MSFHPSKGPEVILTYKCGCVKKKMGSTTFNTVCSTHATLKRLAEPIEVNHGKDKG